MKRMNLMVMPLLIAGLGMTFTACSDDSNDIQAKENVILDADTLQVFDGFDVKFQMLDAQGRPVTKYKEGEDITFKLAVTNKQKETFELPLTFIGEDIFRIFSSNGTDLGNPWDGIGYTKGVITLSQSEYFVISCKAFGKSSEETTVQPGATLVQTQDRNPLPKGSYYTQFELKLNAQGKTPSEGSKGIVCKKSFTIE